MTRDEREVVVVDRGDSGSLKWLLVGLTLGAGLAFLFAPKTGKDLRRDLKKGIRRVRDLADEAIEEFRGETGEAAEPELRAEPAAQYEETEASGGEADAVESRPPRPSLVSAREELERRLAAARARRQSAAPEEEEPVA